MESNLRAGQRDGRQRPRHHLEHDPAGHDGRPWIDGGNFQGLGEEFFQVGDAFVKWCNNAGGINGRKIALTKYDAKLFNVAPSMVQACQKVFMLVGNGNGLDDPGAKPRTDCKLGAIPSYFVSPAAAAAPYQVQPTPNPPEEFQVGPFRLLGLKYPQTKQSGIAVGSSNTARCEPRACAPVTPSSRLGSRSRTIPSVHPWWRTGAHTWKKSSNPGQAAI